VRWRPPLVVRFGRDGVASPTSTVGHLLAVSFVGVIAAGATVSLLSSPAPGVWMPVVLAAWLLLLGRGLRDTWAWLAAPDEERAGFRAEVESLRQWTPPPGYAPILDANRWGRAAWALLVAALGASVALARWHDAVLVPAMFTIAFLVAGGHHLGRRERGRRPARDPAAAPPRP
jgi:hypothetical protein